MSDGDPARLKRLAMRSMRRGIKEMDLILGGFARAGLQDLDPGSLDLYEALLAENDHDLYGWITARIGARIGAQEGGQGRGPQAYGPLLDRIAAQAAGTLAKCQRPGAGPGLRAFACAIICRSRAGPPDPSR